MVFYHLQIRSHLYRVRSVDGQEQSLKGVPSRHAETVLDCLRRLDAALAATDDFMN